MIKKKPELTFDDILLLPNKSDFVMENERKFTNLQTRVSKNLKIDIPITSSPMPGITEVDMAIAIGKMGGLGFLHPFQSKKEQLDQVKQIKKEKVKLAVSVSDLSKEGITYVGKLLKHKVDLICIETAHAHNKQTIQFIKKLKKEYEKIEICAALVVTADATEELIRAGADSIRVGIGGGSHCTTRLVTGIGRPQLTAVEECVKVALKHKIPIISDTGIRYAGDIVKALAFGAESVMIGGLFSGTDQCPGKIIKKHGKYYKHSWGMCTQEAWQNKKPWEKSFDDIKQMLKNFIKEQIYRKPTINHKGFEEGVGNLVPYQGSVVPIVERLNSGVRRSMWYLGAKNIKEIKTKSRVILSTPNTIADNLPRI